MGIAEREVIPQSERTFRKIFLPLRAAYVEYISINSLLYRLSRPSALSASVDRQKRFNTFSWNSWKYLLDDNDAFFRTDRSWWYFIIKSKSDNTWALANKKSTDFEYDLFQESLIFKSLDFRVKLPAVKNRKKFTQYYVEILCAISYLFTYLPYYGVSHETFRNFINNIMMGVYDRYTDQI